VKSRGKILIGTVKGDIHDIGKNLVLIMLTGAGYDVVDAGVDISNEKFAELVGQHQPDILGLSALLTTTMVHMRGVIEALESKQLRSKVKVIIGGARSRKSMQRKSAPTATPATPQRSRLVKGLLVS